MTSRTFIGDRCTPRRDYFPRVPVAGKWARIFLRAGTMTGANGVVVSVRAPRWSRMPHIPSYNLRQAADHTGLSVRHLRRLLDSAGVAFIFVRGVRHYPRPRLEEWWRQYQLQGFDRATNLGPYQRRARGSNGEQVCPGIGQRDDPPCGSVLGRTARGRLARLCVTCRVALKLRRPSR